MTSPLKINSTTAPEDNAPPLFHIMSGRLPVDPVFDLWLRRKGVRLMPSYGDLPARNLAQFAKSIMLIDVVPGSHRFRHRLVGSRLAADFGFGPTGSPLTGQGLALDVGEIFSPVQRVVASRRPLTSSLKTPKSFTGEGQIDMTYLPLSPNNNDIDMVLAYSKDHIARHHAHHRQTEKVS